jgi:dTMP kinase
VPAGIFLVFEGIDASGKSTQARRVATEANALFTFEPGDTAMGAELRRWLLDAATPMKPETEALLMLADRSHHVNKMIAPALSSGRHVVSDRFAGSTLAYQGYGRGVDLELLRAATDLAVGSCRPTLTILLDLPVAAAHARRAPSVSDRFESAELDFHERVRAGFLAQATAENWRVVDATASESDVAGEIDAHLRTLGWPLRD